MLLCANEEPNTGGLETRKSEFPHHPQKSHIRSHWPVARLEMGLPTKNIGHILITKVERLGVAPDCRRSPLCTAMADTTASASTRMLAMRSFMHAKKSSCTAQQHHCFMTF